MSVADEIKQLREELRVSRRERINGRESAPELLDPTPVEMPIGYGGPPSMRELVQAYVRETMSAERDPEMGSFEEEDDFAEENPELLDLSGFEVSEYEMVEEVPPEDTPAAPEAVQEPSEASSEPSSEAEATPEKP